jgi:hypothetical protein
LGYEEGPGRCLTTNRGLADNLSHQGADMTTIINEADNILTGTYGRLTITYRRLIHTWTVTVYNGTLRIDELCGTYDNAHAAWSEARRIAAAAHHGTPLADIIATKPAELALAAVRDLLDTVPTAEPRQVRATLAGAHLTPLAEAQRHALRIAAARNDWTVYAGQVTRPTLRALARKGFGRINYQPGLGRRRVVESLTLNTRGLSAAA